MENTEQTIKEIDKAIKAEKEKAMQEIRAEAVALRRNILKLKKDYDINMAKEIAEYLRES